MYTEAILSFVCALSTIGLRALVNVADRKILTKDKSDFIASMTMNALFPFVLSLALSIHQSAFINAADFLSWVATPGVILSALAAQVSAYSFSFSFKRMDIRNVVVSSKLADLFLPFCIWTISHRFKLDEYIFSIATVLAFSPIMWDVVKNKTGFYKRLAVLMIFAVLFQSSMNEFLNLKPMTDTWPHFLAFVTAVLFWRSLFVMTPLVGRWSFQPKEKEPERKTYFQFLFVRSAIAYLSQVLFFAAMIHGTPMITWPIISAGPLVSTFTAYLFLDEKMGKTEWTAFGMFLFVTLFYVIYKVYL